MDKISINKWFQNQVIKNKIITIYIPLTIIPLLLLGLISNFIFTRAIVNETAKHVVDDSTLIITRINMMLANAESCANLVTSNIGTVINVNEADTQNKISYLQLRSLIKNQLTFILKAFPDLESVTVIDKNSNVFSTDDNFEKANAGLLGADITDTIIEANNQNVWFPMQKREAFVKDRNLPVLTLGKEITLVNDMEHFGILIINIKEDTIASIYSKLASSSNKAYYIIDKEGVVISSLAGEEILKPLKNDSLKQWVLLSKVQSEIKTIDTRRVLVTRVPFGDLGWILVSNVALAELTKSIDKLKTITVIILILCMFFTLSGAGILSSIIVKPLKNLLKSVDKIKSGNIEEDFVVRSSDEVGQLAAGFNAMIVRIRELLINIKSEQKKKREYELALIQSQIKPHFLYNTLDLIYVLNDVGRIKEARDATKMLADFYRAALSKGSEMISIGEEIKNVIAYLYLQRVRYSDVFNFEIDVDSDIYNYSILKLTIQPLVENSIYHGLKCKGSFGHIRVEGIKQDKKIIIGIIDDGVGIAEEKLQKVMNFNHNGASRESFGLASVNERIKLYFGEQYGVVISSQVGKGTEIKIEIPAIDWRQEMNV